MSSQVHCLHLAYLAARYRLIIEACEPDISARLGLRNAEALRVLLTRADSMARGWHHSGGFARRHVTGALALARATLVQAGVATEDDLAEVELQEVMAALERRVPSRRPH